MVPPPPHLSAVEPPEDDENLNLDESREVEVLHVKK